MRSSLTPAAMKSDQMFAVTPTDIPGVMELRPRLYEDMRGRFVKVFHRESFLAAGLQADYAEEYYSVSRRAVIRGLHFQVPPMDHVKLVYCVQGLIQDAVVDLRLGSPTYGQYALTELSAEAGNVLYVPPGLAHGFCTLSEMAVVVYKASTVHSPDHDCGVLWNSLGIPWASEQPILSDRDQSFLPLGVFASPFIYGAAA
jgi:dTDP-4-dehydrorhamnose 3,5-epimerase